MRLPLACLLLPPCLAIDVLQAQELGIVESQVELDATATALGLVQGDRFGAAVASLGDVNGDGAQDVAVGAPGTDDDSAKTGAAWVLFLAADGAIQGSQELSATTGGFTGPLDNVDLFGTSVAGLGDLDQDGVPDLAVGAIGDDNGGNKNGAVWILLLNADGTVKAEQKISDTMGGFSGGLDNVEEFGLALGAAGDVDGDGVGDLAVGASIETSTGVKQGGLYLLFLNPDGTVKASQEISAREGGFTGVLDNVDEFGSAVVGIGDLDQDGVPDLAAGAPGDDDGGSKTGAVWVLFLNPDGTVKAQQKISAAEGGFGGALAPGDRFGSALALLGDLDPDEQADLVVGAPGDAGAGALRGAVWMLFLQGDGTVEDWTKAGDAQGGFTGALANGDALGSALALLGDLDGNGLQDVLAGAPGDAGSGPASGAVWQLLLREATEVSFLGSGINPEALLPGAQPPTIGKVWDPIVVQPSDGESIFHFLGVSRSPAGLFLAADSFDIYELLISLEPGEVLFCLTTEAGTSFEIPVPDNPLLIGLDLYAQGGILFYTGDFLLTNRLDIVIGL
jgi:hypothetical protein